MIRTFRAHRFHKYGGSENLIVESIAAPELKPDELLIEVHYAGVNPVDWKIRSGYLKDFMPVPLPFIPGSDVSGVVVETGSGVANFKKGQAVFGIANGSYAEYAVASSSGVVLKPEGLSFELAATIPLGALTAWKAVEDAGVKSGQAVAILGAAGGVGAFAVQFARLKGAKVIGTCSTDNVEYLRTLGVEKVVDYKKTSIEAEIRDADVVIDLVGGDSLEKAYGLAKVGGVLVTIAGQVSEEKAKARGIRALGSGRGPLELMEKISELAAAGTLRTEAGRIFPFAEAKAAQDLSQTGHGRGRILLKVK